MKPATRLTAAASDFWACVLKNHRMRLVGKFDRIHDFTAPVLIFDVFVAVALRQKQQYARHHEPKFQVYVLLSQDRRVLDSHNAPQPADHLRRRHPERYETLIIYLVGSAAPNGEHLTAFFLQVVDNRHFAL